MDFRNCPVCDGLFRYVSRNLCPSCIEAEEKEFETVRQYVRDHDKATILEVSEATGVGEDKIIRFLREGRLVARGLSTEGLLTCDRCGKSISGGKMCDACRAEISQEFSRKIGDKSGADQASPPKSDEFGPRNRMYTADIVKRK